MKIDPKTFSLEQGEEIQNDFLSFGESVKLSGDAQFNVDMLKIDIDDVNFSYNISSSVTELTEDIVAWYHSWADDIVTTVCCVIEYFLTIMVNPKGLEYIAALGRLLKTMAISMRLDFTNDLDIFRVLKKFIEYSFVLSTDMILGAVKRTLHSFIDKLIPTISDNSIWEKCFHLNRLLQSVKEFLDSLLDFEISVKGSITGMISSELRADLGIDAYLRVYYQSKYLEQAGDFLLGLVSMIYGILDMIPCDIIKFEQDYPGLSEVLTEALQTYNNPDSPYWNNDPNTFIETKNGTFKRPSEYFITEVSRIVSQHYRSQLTHTQSFADLAKMIPYITSGRFSDLDTPVEFTVSRCQSCLDLEKIIKQTFDT